MRAKKKDTQQTEQDKNPSGLFVSVANFKELNIKTRPSLTCRGSGGTFGSNIKY